MSARAAFAAAVAALVTIGSASRALAQPAERPELATTDAVTEAVSTSVEGHAGCRDSEFFLQQILARTPRARRAAPGEVGRVFRLRIAAQGPNSTGTLVIRDVTGAESSRDVTAATCDEVVVALALVAALTIDPHAVTTPGPLPPPEASPPVPPVAPTPPAKPPPPSPARSPQPKSPEPTAPRATEPPERDDTAKPQRHVRLGAHGGAEVMSGITPDLTLLPRAAIELELTLASSWWVPALRLSAARGEGSATAVGVGRATFVWTGARIELCPLRAGAGVGPYARPCLGTDIAVIDAQGRDLYDPRSASRPWIGPLIALRAGWRLPFGLLAEIYGGGSFPLVDDKFQFDDRRVPEKVTVHDVPSLSFFTGLAAGFSGDIL